METAPRNAATATGAGSMMVSTGTIARLRTSKVVPGSAAILPRARSASAPALRTTSRKGAAAAAANMRPSSDPRRPSGKAAAARRSACTSAALPPGTNPIAWSTDGTLYVGEAVTADGLYEVTPPEGGQTSAPAPRTISDAVGNVNAFDVGPGGLIYGPNYVDQTGTVVAIDPADGAVTTIADIPGYPTALRTIDDHRLLVLANLPSALYEVDLSTLPAADDPNPPEDPRATVTPRGDVVLATVDNFTVAPDGTIYVTSFNQPTVLAIAPDGTTRTITIGTPS